MRAVIVSTQLDCPAATVWLAVKTPHAFVHVAKGMLRFPAAEKLDRPWRVADEIHGWTYLFGIMPFSHHHLMIESINEFERTLVTSEHGGLIRTWKHRLAITSLTDRSCTYEDRIDIDAGVVTLVVAAYAKVFYRYRQRRWQTLARLLAASSPEIGS